MNVYMCVYVYLCVCMNGILAHDTLTCPRVVISSANVELGFDLCLRVYVFKEFKEGRYQY